MQPFHVMLDLETLGNNPFSVIASIGAVFFDPLSDHLGEEFHVKVNIESCTEAGLKMDASTITWWLAQSDAARISTFGGGTELLPNALGMFSDFLRKSDDIKKLRIWGNGSDFDNVILGNAYKALGYQVPWSYGKNRCFRTVNNLVHPSSIIMPQREGTHHNALDDAKHQARVLQAIVSAQGIILS